MAKLEGADVTIDEDTREEVTSEDASGAEKVGTKEGTTKFGLPCCDAAAPALTGGLNEGLEKPAPEAAKSEACAERPYWGTPPIEEGTPDEVCKPADCSADKACLTAATTEAKNSGDGTLAAGCEVEAWLDDGGGISPLGGS